MATQVASKAVRRSFEAPIGGVCAGLAERFDLDPIVVRILAIFIALHTAGLGLVVYALLWARLPRTTEIDVPYEIRPESAESSSFGSVDCETGRATSAVSGRGRGSVSFLARLTMAIGLIMLFLVIAGSLSPLLPGSEWWQFWPISLIITGLCIMVIPIPTQYEASWHALGIVVTSVAATLLPISLDMLAWETLPLAFSKGWLFVLAAAVLFAFGLYKKSDSLVICAAFFIVAFCVFALTMCAVPGIAQPLQMGMFGDRPMAIAFFLH